MKVIFVRLVWWCSDFICQSGQILYPIEYNCFHFPLFFCAWQTLENRPDQGSKRIWIITLYDLDCFHHGMKFSLNGLKNSNFKFRKVSLDKIFPRHLTFFVLWPSCLTVRCQFNWLWVKQLLRESLKTPEFMTGRCNCHLQFEKGQCLCDYAKGCLLCGTVFCGVLNIGN